MQNIFVGTSTILKSQYAERTGTELTLATNKASAVRLMRLERASHAFNIDNGTNAEIQLLLVNPDELARTKVEWIRLGAGRNLDLQLFNLNLQLEAGLEIWAHIIGAAPSSTTKLRIITWG